MQWSTFLRWTLALLSLTSLLGALFSKQALKMLTLRMTPTLSLLLTTQSLERILLMVYRKEFVTTLYVSLFIYIYIYIYIYMGLFFWTIYIYLSTFGSSTFKDEYQYPFSSLTLSRVFGRWSSTPFIYECVFIHILLLILSISFLPFFVYV